MRYCIRSFDKAVDTASFHSAQPALDEYIRRYASQDVRRNVARVFLATPENDPQHLAGFFTLSAGSVSCSDLPESLAKKLPRYPVPVALLGRLAVATEFQRQGLGSILLVDACQKVAHASAVLAVAGIVVDVKDETAESFYKHFGFLAMPGDPARLLLPASAFNRSDFMLERGVHAVTLAQ
jgi:GNAT superfamily N-acetyltransferase